MAGLQSAAIDPGCRFDILETCSSATEEDDARIVEGIAEISNRVLERSLGDLVDALNDFDLYGIFSGCRDLAGALVGRLRHFLRPIISAARSDRSHGSGMSGPPLRCHGVRNEWPY